ncbi:DUF58 domain-containing protein [Chromatocurvus halotolerans]|uniref:Uncharacterized protein DUF58 n=1 Tax=Chromatocurvus halotolerans TaxID=1132028 RepID=A0A4R2KSB5_9GAMM|nr:DUF58 domain-containing protein [Chromatocurvus halotolerans]TCO75682.1 uncharacterized protein DUF58 [Chromatocurvus halotolerans]
MLIAAINYENNMSYALTFLLATLFVVAVLHTYANLSGLTLHGSGGGSGFPGDLLPFSVRLMGGRQSRYALRVRWRDSSLGAGEAQLDVPPNASTEAQLYARASQRGRFLPGRLLVESSYPLGLLRCWTSVDLALSGIVYPSPQRHPDILGGSDPGQRGRWHPRPGEDEFYGLREYRKGDRPRQVYWKGLARGQSLQSKQYSTYASEDDWLDWDSYPGVPTEQRLSYLCYQCLQLHARRQQYGLRLPGLRLSPSDGAAHRDRVLTALALHGLTQE